jgi:hypothetical protein
VRRVEPQLAKAIASVRRTVPLSVVNTVSITSVPGEYPRVTENASAGRIDQWPAAGSRIRAKTAGLS